MKETLVIGVWGDYFIISEHVVYIFHTHAMETYIYVIMYICVELKILKNNMLPFYFLLNAVLFLYFGVRAEPLLNTSEKQINKL